MSGLRSSAPPPRVSLVVLGGSIAGTFVTVYWLPVVSIPFGVVAIGTGIYALSRFARPRFLVVPDESEAVRAVVVRPELGAVSREVGAGRVRALPSGRRMGG